MRQLEFKHITDIDTVIMRFNKLIERTPLSFETCAKCSEETLRSHEDLYVVIDKDGDMHLIYPEPKEMNRVAMLMGDDIFEGCVE